MKVSREWIEQTEIEQAERVLHAGRFNDYEISVLRKQASVFTAGSSDAPANGVRWILREFSAGCEQHPGHQLNVPPALRVPGGTRDGADMQANIVRTWITLERFDWIPLPPGDGE